MEDFFSRYSADQIRYVIAANAPETADSEFTWKDFQTRCNAELLGKFGNLANRILVFVRNNCEGKAPPFHQLQQVDQDFLTQVNQLAQQAAGQYETFRLRRASQIFMDLAQLGNAYFDSKRPWQDAKKPETRAAMETTLACCLQCLKVLALISYPIIPETASKLWQMLGYQTDLKAASWKEIIDTALPPGQILPEPKVLFARIEDEQIAQEIAKLHAMTKRQVPKKEVEYAPLNDLIDIEDFRKADLRVGIILSAAAVPKSKKLLKLEVDLGFEKRIIVSGISQHYKPEDIVGKKVVVVANLKPATLMGIQSQGMILAASWDQALKILEIEDLPAGSVIS